MGFVVGELSSLFFGGVLGGLNQRFDRDDFVGNGVFSPHDF